MVQALLPSPVARPEQEPVTDLLTPPCLVCGAQMDEEFINDQPRLQQLGVSSGLNLLVCSVDWRHDLVDGAVV
jgi:hypothetical protein